MNFINVGLRRGLLLGRLCHQHALMAVEEGEKGNKVRLWLELLRFQLNSKSCMASIKASLPGASVSSSAKREIRAYCNEA